MDLNRLLLEHKNWFFSKGSKGKRAKFGAIQLEDLDLRKACLVEANCQGTQLINVDLRGADLRGINLQDSILVRCNLEDANLEEADLMWSVFKGSDLTNVFFNGTYLQGADLGTTKGLTWAQLLFASWDKDTELPISLTKTSL